MPDASQVYKRSIIMTFSPGASICEYAGHEDYPNWTMCRRFQSLHQAAMDRLKLKGGGGLWGGLFSIFRMCFAILYCTA